MFVEDWDVSEDTTLGANSLPVQRKDVKLLFGKGQLGGIEDEFAPCKTDNTVARNFFQQKAYLKKKSSDMTERDWRIFREDNDILIRSGKCPTPARTWDELALPREVKENVDDQGYKLPTPIQMQGIPIGLTFKDMIGLAPTGSGKSAAFLLPVITFLLSQPPIDGHLIQDGPYALIMAPARELAQQIEKEFVKLAYGTRLRSAVLVGGKSAEE